MLGIVLFTAGSLSAKLLALVVLATASMPAAVSWCTAEALALQALRFVAERRVWRFHVEAMPTLLVNAIAFLCMLGAPLPVLRCESR